MFPEGDIDKVISQTGSNGRSTSGAADRTGFALSLSVLGLVFEVSGFLMYGFLFVLAPLLGFAGLLLAVATVRHRHHTAVVARAAVAILVGGLVFLSSVLFFVSFVVNPPE